MFPYKSIYIAGHNGMVGSAVHKLLKLEKTRIITRTRKELDLRDKSLVLKTFKEEKPECVIFSAAKVGGILANANYPVEFLCENLEAQISTITSAYEAGVKRFLFLGSTCIYPKMAEQPIHESSLLTSPLEPTNEAYALAKICGLKLCQYYRTQYGAMYHSLMPTNLYGPRDNYHPENSHVLPALLSRFHEAKINNLKEVQIWGTGSPKREFLYVEDLARAIIMSICLSNPPDWMNVGCGDDISILNLAHKIAETVDYKGKITTDRTKPDGTPRKLTDISIISKYGWRPTVPLSEGLFLTYKDFLDGRSKKRFV